MILIIIIIFSKHSQRHNTRESQYNYLINRHLTPYLKLFLIIFSLEENYCIIA